MQVVLPWSVWMEACGENRPAQACSFAPRPCASTANSAPVPLGSGLALTTAVYFKVPGGYFQCWKLKSAGHQETK